MNDKIIVKGAKENNLKNVNVTIPRNSFVLFTGLSGSGKSSLAFNTIYEEGRRRYIDSLSSYARQFLGGTKKPNVESIDGLSPAISIEQKTTHNNPRSIVGTVTEIYDYLRLLYARVGKAYCPNHKIEITAQRSKDILDAIYQNPKGEKIYILAPLVTFQKGSHQTLLASLKRDGFLRVKINDEIYSLDNEITLDKNKKWTIELVIDRLVLEDDIYARVAEAVENALEYGKGLVVVEVPNKSKTTFSINHSCEFGDFNMPKIEPKLFSFNSPAGMCLKCKGLGALQKVDFDLLCPDKSLSIAEGGIIYYKNLIGTLNLEWQEFNSLLKYYDIDINTPIMDLSKEQINIIKHGSYEPIAIKHTSSSGYLHEATIKIEGVVDKIERRYFETKSEEWRTYYKKFLADIPCDECHGARLNKYALSVKIANLNINEICDCSIEKINTIINGLELNDLEQEISSLILTEIKHRVTFLINVGLQYLTLNRKAETLSGGEAQRIRLATQIGSNLTGVLYVLDEPSIGLHQKDNEKLLNSLKHMVSIGNSLIVVEHDEDTIRQADYVVDIGPRAGEHGGEIVFSGKVDDLMKCENSITGKYLNGDLKIEVPKSRRSGNGKVLVLKHAKTNNLKDVTLSLPLGKLIAITGVSGSGKSSLINEELVTRLSRFLNSASYDIRKDADLSGQFNVDKLVQITQTPIGRTPRSNPATYTSVFDDIRDVFAATEEAKIRGYSRSRFSFNIPGGRCDKCQGDGAIRIEMHFLPDVYVTCDHCNGKRYNLETLEIKYHGKSIYDVLSMTIEQAYNFFLQRSKIRDKLETLLEVGLGYITLGQSATTLSGGEAQRVKLATYLQKKPTGKSLYVLDEPTTGLHPYDVSNLLNVLNKIVNNGDTVVVIEHNLDVIKCADHIIDLGPDGGEGGGQIIVSGTPEQVAKHNFSYTAEYLRKILN
ncbi:cobalt ABC transporter ATP-binding protein [Metamycoplasma arthritidis]|uniref:UvrABC system protein A n=1 Tax=Metamycoplasma arthritidis (strain 158L3-1) TaxID=243272 RepID=B3PMS9_META1|nr:excinuclease ABC subunit UvrA [Metamycoplasma arthritidis]ACF07331.1 excinuclease ABC subunit A [Metamycoplasma arthritidis 158L3-1]VEU78854.1 cobalt ABC transporter ATP-binding protein [Metamycoplasma arthritidis]